MVKAQVDIQPSNGRRTIWFIDNNVELKSDTFSGRIKWAINPSFPVNLNLPGASWSWSANELLAADGNWQQTSFSAHIDPESPSRYYAKFYPLIHTVGVSFNFLFLSFLFGHPLCDLLCHYGLCSETYHVSGRALYASS